MSDGARERHPPAPRGAVHHRPLDLERVAEHHNVVDPLVRGIHNSGSTATNALLAGLGFGPGDSLDDLAEQLSESGQIYGRCKGLGRDHQGGPHDDQRSPEAG
jgi:hypothetical protein